MRPQNNDHVKLLSEGTEHDIIFPSLFSQFCDFLRFEQLFLRLKSFIKLGTHASGDNVRLSLFMLGLGLPC